MSLLEDVFLEDEADEAQALERVIEGDEYDDRPRSRSVTPDDDDENVNRDDEAEEDKRRVDPSSTKAKKVTKNPRFILNPARLTGPRGIQVIPEHFKDFKFKGKGHEKEDLDMVLKKLEHWAYRLYPKFQFEDCLKKIETLGKKRPVMVHLHKIRTDQFISEDTIVQKDSSDEETAPQEEDEFDKLLQQQIELARATPAPGSVKKVIDTPRQDRSPFTMPKATSSPSISDEQKERMIRNRKLAEERRLARLKQSMDNEKQDNSNISDIKEVSFDKNHVEAKIHNRSNNTDSSDDECDVTSVNKSITVDVHSHLAIDETFNNRKSIEKEINDKNTDNDEILTEIKNSNDLVGAEKEVDDIEMDNFGAKNDVIEEVVDKNDIDTNCKSKEDNNIVVIEDNDNFSDDTNAYNRNLTVDVNETAPISDIDTIIIDDNIISDQRKSPKSDNPNEKPNNVEENITKSREDPVLIDLESNGDNNKVDNLQKPCSMEEEITEDVMDVDFSDDF